MRFLLDHDVPDDIVFTLATLGHEVVRLRELMPTTTSDEAVLQLARERDNVLITCNRRDNTTRGILAEFLVAKAVGDERGVRIGWNNFDAEAPDGATIEVKCSALLQSWTQRQWRMIVNSEVAAWPAC